MPLLPEPPAHITGYFLSLPVRLPFSTLAKMFIPLLKHCQEAAHEGAGVPGFQVWGHTALS